jgi:hypothetical protein
MKSQKELNLQESLVDYIAIGDVDAEDVSLRPGPNADTQEEVRRHIDPEIMRRYEIYSYRHAAAILATSFPNEFKQLQKALLDFTITKREIGMPGGNESDIAKKLSSLLRPSGWYEARIQGDLVVRMAEYEEILSADGTVKKNKRKTSAPKTLENFIDGHKIDYVKGKVALDLEWNSKDQTFDRDLYAFRTFHDCGLISAGVMVTRSASLNPIFDKVPLLNKQGEEISVGVRKKYGASTTWMGKLLYRLNAGRHGGCPILVFGITPESISD